MGNFIVTESMYLAHISLELVFIHMLHLEIISSADKGDQLGSYQHLRFEC